MKHLLAWVVPLVMFGCGGGPSGFTDAGGNDAGGADASLDVNLNFPETSPGDGSTCGNTCSSDLHEVIDCNGNVVSTCMGTDGCDVATGSCVNACQAAVDNKNSIGCEYYATFMDQDDGASACFVAFVANTWNTPVTINVDFNGMTYTNVASFTRIPSGKGQSITYGAYAGTLPPGEVAILFLGGDQGTESSGNPVCPITTASGTTSMLSGTGFGHSFHITTDVPIVAYEMNPYGGGDAAVTGASLLLPVSAWDTNYIASTASAYMVDNPGITIVAAQDGTQVTLLPKVALVRGNGIPSGPANKPVDVQPDRGREQAQIEQQADLVGSVIQSNYPVGVMAGNACMNTPTGTIFCDHGEQMLPPVRALGNEYVGVMYRSRTGEPAIWRIVGAVDGTTLSFSPSIPAGSGYTAPPTTVNQGDLVEFSTATPFVVTSQDASHPFELFQYMSGSGLARSRLKNSEGYGDPDFSVQVPPAAVPLALRHHDRPDLPGDVAHAHPAAGRDQHVPGRLHRLPRLAAHGLASGRQVRVHATRPPDRQLHGRRDVLERPSRAHEQRAVRPRDLGLGHAAHDELHGQRLLLVTRRHERAAHQHGHRSPDAALEMGALPPSPRLAHRGAMSGDESKEGSGPPWTSSDLG